MTFSRSFRAVVSRCRRALDLAAFWSGQAKTRRFCEKWAGLQSAEYEFAERHEDTWLFPWRVEFFDLHRWNGSYSHWNGHEAGAGEGLTRAAAWKSMAKEIIKYENASSEAEALLKAEIAFRCSMPRGWGDDEYRAFYSCLA